MTEPEAAVLARDVEAFMQLHDPEVRVFAPVGMDDSKAILQRG